MIKIKEALVVEGKYDKIKLSSLVDGVVVTTNGFRIFKDVEKLNLIRKLAETTGIIVLTDSDRAGFIIRNYLKSCVNSGVVKHAYVPDVYGKEKRKAVGAKEGKIGVEGMSESAILEALEKAMDLSARREDLIGKAEIDKAAAYELGLVGAPGCSARRNRLKKKLGLPEYLSVNELVETLGLLTTREELEKILTEDDYESKDSASGRRSYRLRAGGTEEGGYGKKSGNIRDV